MSKKSINSLSGLSNLKKEFTKSENDDLLKELKNHWKLSALRFVGRLAKNKKSGRYYFFDIRNLDGVEVLYPNNEKITISIGSLCSLKINSAYEFSVFLASEKIREKYDNKYHLVIDDKESIIPYVSEKKYVTDLLKRKEEGHLKFPENARENAELLSKNTYEINKKPETFIYELIQNADDYPKDKSRKNTEMTFRIIDNFLVVAHNGSKFNKDNVRAISTIGDKDKRNQKDTIGYKGMGFKSIYKFSDHVWINSGGFSFKFEKEYYTRLGKIIEDIAKNEYLTKKQLLDITFSRYDLKKLSEKRALQLKIRLYNNLEKLIKYNIINVNGIDDKEDNLILSLSELGERWEEIILSEGFNMPWQTLPLWTSPQSSLNQIEKDLLDENVTIFIKPNGRGRELRQNLKILEDFFITNFQGKDRILLFLRGVSSISFFGKDSEFQSKIEEGKWEISRLPNITIKPEITNSIKEEINSDNGDKRIPEKFGEMSSTEITFATKKNESEVYKTDNSKVFAYLPTDWNLGFDFLINGNFIATGSREELFDDIEWNLYLIEEAGRLFIQWISNMITKLGNTSPYKILPDIDSIIFREKSEKKLLFLERFKLGMKKGVLETPFVLDVNNTLCLLDDIIIDRTGFSEIISEAVFKEKLNIDKNILQKDINNKSWFDNQLSGTQVEIFDWDTLKENSTELTSILKAPITNVKFINFLISSDKMYDFKDIAFVLTKTGELEKPSNVYINITEDDLLFVSKLDVHQMNAEVKSGLIDEYQNDFIEYDGYKFIQDEIISKANSVNGMLETVEESKELFNHLLKYSNQFNSSNLNQLGNLKIYTVKDENVKINEGDLYIYHHTLQNLIEENCFPTDHFQIVSSKYSLEIHELLKSLGVKFYLPVKFIQDELCDSINEINNHILMMDDNSKLKSTQGIIELIISSRKLFSEDVAKSIFDSCKDLEVLTKDNELMPLSKCYLSNEYTGNKEIEDLMEGFPKKSLSFVSPSYPSGSKYDNKEWKKTLKLLRCSDDHLSFVKKTLLSSKGEKLKELNEHQIVSATKLIFKYQNKLENELTSLNYFPVLTNSGIIDIYKDDVYLGKEYYIGLDPDIENLIKKCLSDNIVSNKYTLKEYKDWKKFWILIRACDEQKNYEIIEDCFKYLIDNDNTIDIKFDSILSWMKAHPKLSESHLPSYIQKNLVTPNLNEELCYSGQLFINSLKDVIDDNERVCAIDLNDYSEVQESLSLLTELDIDTCIKILNRQKTITWLNDNKIINRINTLLTEEHESFPEDFIANGKVMNQKKEWVLISELFCIEEGFNENLGIKTSKHIIHKDFNKLSSELGVVELTEEDFEFNPIGAEQDIHLINILLERMKYIAFIKDTELYDKIEDDLKEKINTIIFKKCKKISLQFEEIKKDDFSFWPDEDEEILYYIGNWKEFSAAKMFEWIFNYLELSGDGIRRAFERILLAHDHIEIVEYLEENGYNIPEEWKIKEGLKVDEAEETAEEPEVEKTAEEPEAEETSDEEASLAEDEYDKTISDEEDSQESYKVNYSESEIAYLESIITGEIDFGKSDQFEINKNAIFRSILFLRDEGYNLLEGKLESFMDNNVKQFVNEEGEITNFIIRSAVKGVLFLDPSSWEKLEIEDFSLLIYEGSERVTQKNTRESLIVDYADFNKFGLVRIGNDYNVKDFDNLLFERDEEFEDEKYDKYKLLFLLKENEQAKEFINIFSNIGGANDSE